MTNQNPPRALPRPAPYSGTAATLTQRERAEAARQMRNGGSFAAAIAEAYFVADSDNEARLINHFGHLFLKFHRAARDEVWACACNSVRDYHARLAAGQTRTMLRENIQRDALIFAGRDAAFNVPQFIAACNL